MQQLGRSERKYWVQFGSAMHERKDKRVSDLITKLTEHAGSLFSGRRRK